MNSPRQRGFTLIELIIFIVVVGIGVAGILSVFTTSVKNSADPMVRKQTLAIAESLLEEIVQKEYASAGYSGASRTLFDDVGDYSGYTAGSIVDAAGTTIAGLPGYSVTSVVVGAPAALTGGGATLVKKIEVTITGPQGAITLTGYRGNY